MPHFLSSILNKNWERKLVVVLILVLGGLYFTWEIILEEPPEPLPRQTTLPQPPHLFQWETDTPEFLMPNEGSNIDNPFVTQFPLEKPTVIMEPVAQQPVVTPVQPETPPLEPPKRTVVIKFNGLRTALTGSIFAILEVSDSAKGASTIYTKLDDALDCGLHVTAISDKEIRISNEKGEELQAIPYGDTKIFILENEE